MSPSLNLSWASRTLCAFVKKIRSPREFISSPLYNLPLELLLQISAYLVSPALCSFRLTCKSLYDCTLPQFCKTYLKTITTDLFLAFLQRLDILSRNPRLCLHVCSLNINGTREDNPGSNLHWERPASGLITIPQDAVQRWQDVLQRLVNCQSFHVPPDILTPCDTVTILLSIITSIERPLRELGLLFKASNSVGGNRIDMARVNNGLPQEPKFITACSNLESLTFNFAMETEEVLFVAQIIRNATRLQRLTIDADYGEHSTSLMSHLNLYSAQITVPIPLRELTLGTAHVGSSHASTEFLASLQHSLIKVSFTAVHLDSGDWASVLRALSKLPLLTDISTWVFGQPEFQRVHFPAILQDPVVDPVLGTKFSYTVRKLRQGQRTLMVAYSGRSMDIALQKLADFATPYKATG
ncbi:hypothetical protein BDV19DRAFT_382842 [Aspergillus venezuelensis]